MRSCAPSRARARTMAGRSSLRWSRRWAIVKQLPDSRGRRLGANLVIDGRLPVLRGNGCARHRIGRRRTRGGQRTRVYRALSRSRRLAGVRNRLAGRACGKISVDASRSAERGSAEEGEECICARLAAGVAPDNDDVRCADLRRLARSRPWLPSSRWTRCHPLSPSLRPTRNPAHGQLAPASPAAAKLASGSMLLPAPAEPAADSQPSAVCSHSQPRLLTC